MNMVDDRLTVHQLIRELEENQKEEVWIWMGQNQHDVCGYYWLISQLAAFQGRVVVLYLNNLPFINEKGQIFYPTRTAPDPAERIPQGTQAEPESNAERI
jgi:hypothetical protein